MKSKLLTLLLVFVLIFSTCSIVMAEEARTIGVIIGAPEAPFFKIVEDGIAAACQELGWETMVTYGKNEKVMEHGRLFISQEVDAIINFGVTTNTGEQLVEEATAAGIPVVDVDVDCGGYFFGANNELAGAVLGDALADYLEENVPNHADLSMKAVMFWSGNEGEVVRMRLTGVVKGLNERGITNISMDNNYENDTIGFVNKQDAAHRFIDFFFGFKCCLTHVSGNQTRPVNLHQLSFFENTELFINLGEQPCNGSFSRSGISKKNQML